MDLKHKIISGVFWQGLARIGSQSIGFVISIVLARLLAPKEFGIIALMTVFTSWCGVHFGLRFIGSPWFKLFAGGRAITCLYLAGIIMIGKFPAEIANLLKHRRV